MSEVKSFGCIYSFIIHAHTLSHTYLRGILLLLLSYQVCLYTLFFVVWTVARKNHLFELRTEIGAAACKKKTKAIRNLKATFTEQPFNFALFLHACICYASLLPLTVHTKHGSLILSGPVKIKLRKRDIWLKCWRFVVLVFRESACERERERDRSVSFSSSSSSLSSRVECSPPYTSTPKHSWTWDKLFGVCVVYACTVEPYLWERTSTTKMLRITMPGTAIYNKTQTKTFDTHTQTRTLSKRVLLSLRPLLPPSLSVYYGLL